jgi:6-pyruvoyltetrahydropterin/6-carboxytetrahydropterin synthase
MHGHGHNYVLEVTVAGEPNPETGYVIDLKTLKAIVMREIIEKVDHKHLNHDVEFLDGVIPTAENIARAFWKILEPQITEGKLHSVRLHETENNVVEVLGG